MSTEVIHAGDVHDPVADATAADNRPSSGDASAGAADEDATTMQVNAILNSLNSDEIDMLRDAFIYMDRDSDGFVGFDELMVAVYNSVGKERYAPLHTYLSPIFHVADKDGDGRLGLTEFLLSYVDGPGVVPAEVVNSCVAAIRVRLSDEEITTLQESFRRIDTNEDGFIDRDELIVALKDVLLSKFPDLEETSFAEIVNVVMTSADADGDGKLCLAEFIRSYQEDQGVLPAAFIETPSADAPAPRQLTPTEVEVIKEAFAALDRDHDGVINYSELYQTLWDSLATAANDDEFIRELCDLIMVTADRKRTGTLSLDDFVQSFVRHVDVMSIPAMAARDTIKKACDKLLEMHASGELAKLVVVFDDLDKDKDGYVEQAELAKQLTSIFATVFPEWDSNTVTAVMQAAVMSADVDRDGRLSLDEFVRSFAEGSGVVPWEIVNSWHRLSRHGSDAAEVPHSIIAQVEEKLSPALPTSSGPTGTAENTISVDEFRTVLRQAFGAGNEERAERVADRVLSSPRVTKSDNNTRVKAAEVLAELRFLQDGVAENGSPVKHSPANSAGASGLNAKSLTAGETRAADDVAADHTRTPSISAAGEETNNSPHGATPHAPAAPPPPRSPAHLDASTPTARPYTPLRKLSEQRRSTEPTAVVAARRLSERNQAVAALAAEPVVKSSETTIYEVNWNRLLNDELFEEFLKYDVNKVGHLDRATFKKAYMQMENYGLEPTSMEVDRLFSKYGSGDTISFNEFCVLMLQRTRM